MELIMDQSVIICQNVVGFKNALKKDNWHFIQFRFQLQFSSL